MPLVYPPSVCLNSLPKVSRYALTANIGSGSVAVIRAEDREVVDVVATDRNAHAAVPSPDGDQAAVAHVKPASGAGGESLVELVWDEGRETYETTGRRLDLANAPELADKAKFPNGSAVCPAYTADGESIYVTLGGGGLVVVDAETFQIVRAYGKDQFAANGCGLVLSEDGSTMYANAGTLTGGSLYAFDTATHDLIQTTEAGGLDPHGMMVLRDGSLLVLNRLSDTATLHDQDTLAVEKTIPVGDAPDLIMPSTDGRFAYITLRGAKPATGTHDLAGTTPGMQILQLNSMRVIKTVRLDESPHGDPHGIAVRPIPVSQ